MRLRGRFYNDEVMKFNTAQATFPRNLFAGVSVRQEIKTGEAVGGKLHSIKAANTARQLEKLVNTGTLSTKDTTLAKALIQDLRNARAGN
ncbi:MAG: hypothetical protein ACRD4S_08960 [Candidatus Acidiferrales bacterium]